MENVIIVLIIIAITLSIIWYLVRTKKHGVKCVGCPYAKQCGSSCNVSCSPNKKVS